MCNIRMFASTQRNVQTILAHKMPIINRDDILFYAFESKMCFLYSRSNTDAPNSGVSSCAMHIKWNSHNLIWHLNIYEKFLKYWTIVNLESRVALLISIVRVISFRPHLLWINFGAIQGMKLLEHRNGLLNRKKLTYRWFFPSSVG